MTATTNVFDWLDQVRERRSMYAHSLAELESMVRGYYTALETHDVVELGPQLTQGHFGVWLRVRTGWATECGFAHAIVQHSGPDVDRHFETFFSLVDEYRAIEPTVIARVTLDRRHQPTGKRVTIGFDGRVPRPDEVLVVQYSPTSLHHLRHRYGNRTVDDSMLYLSDGSHETSLSDAMEWVADEFGVHQRDWSRTG